MGVRSAQDGAVEGQDQFSRRKEWKKNQEKDLTGQLLIVETPFHTFLPSFRRGFAGQEGGEHPVAGGLTLNQGVQDVSDTLQRVAPEERNPGFQEVGELGKLDWSGIGVRHRSVMPLAPCREGASD